MPTVRFILDPNRLPEVSDETAARWDALADEDIDFSDAPELDPAFWREVEPHTPGPKPTVTMRVDPEVVAHFKKEDPKGYTRRMAEVLGSYVRAKAKR
ncbi:BrnA antitoxin family protein [Salinarimonas chemoclinalis]|uniref:BrnA antitoxin family protein n=1 Tax=Salinarimonas chemoclinalis TaxID=3241599 RepID=UPI0035576A67